MIALHPLAALDLLAAREFYARHRPGLGALFELAAERTMDAVEARPLSFAPHPFATKRDVRRALFLPPPRFPYAVAYALAPDGAVQVLAFEHLRRRPSFWASRLDPA